MQMIKQVIVKYNMTSVFDIPPNIDLNTVYDWYIKRDTLCIQVNQEGHLIDFILPRPEDQDNYKDPVEVLDENYTIIKCFKTSKGTLYGRINT